MTPDVRRRAGLLGLLLAVQGCGGSGPGDGLDDMYAHFSRVGEAQTAVVEGNLDRARSAARWVAQQGRIESLPPGGEAREAELRRVAARTAEAPDLSGAAEGTAAMGAACGACHAAVAGGPAFSELLPPIVPTPNATPRARRMIRHVWAADRMWEGLMGPSDARWRAGAEAFAALPPEIEGIPSRRDTGGWSRLLPALGEQALEAESQEARAGVYGSLLETCSSCHTALGVGRGP